MSHKLRIKMTFTNLQKNWVCKNVKLTGETYSLSEGHQRRHLNKKTVFLTWKNRNKERLSITMDS